MSLAKWLIDYSASDEYPATTLRMAARDGMIYTAPDETGTLYTLIRHLKPKLCLEIGTFFAHTSQIMAEAIHESGSGGKLVTIDPFGAERVPQIIQTWPAELQALTEFRPWSSMQYFLDMETHAVPKGAESPLSVVFVDGHHNFEYAIFDIVRSADHLTPGGVIVIDNLEQEGPKRAVAQFLQWNPAWSMFYKGAVYNAASLDPEMFQITYERETLWCVLLAPQGIQVARQVCKLMKRGVPYAPIAELAFKPQTVSHAGQLRANFVYYAIPYDFHITGEGMQSQRVSGTAQLTEGATHAVIRFETPLALNVHSEMNIGYELELSYESDASKDAFIVLDAAEPVETASSVFMDAIN